MVFVVRDLGLTEAGALSELDVGRGIALSGTHGCGQNHLFKQSRNNIDVSD